jgi:hypothetical protein
MTTRDPGSEESAELIITGRVGALRDLAESGPALSDLQLKVMRWYGELSRRLTGPRSGDERGPAQQPPWVKQGPMVTKVNQCAEEDGRLSYMLEGSELDRTTSVWIDGAPARGWEALSAGRLLVPIPADTGRGDAAQIVIEVRTTAGDVVARAGGPESSHSS